MSAYSGPNVVNDGLVLSLDAANLKSKDLTSIQVLVVGGGGEGGAHVGGGGGGGGVLTGIATVAIQDYAITVGAGGGGAGSNQQGVSGENSSAFGLTAIGGGGGGTWGGQGNPNGKSGGSGGGAGGTDAVQTGTGGAGINGQGFQGGNTGTRNGQLNSSGAGGGGAGVAALDRIPAFDVSRRDGGDGILSSITGSILWYGGGGGSGSFQSVPGGNGGKGGGGGGSSTRSTSGVGDTNGISSASDGVTGNTSIGGNGGTNTGGGGGGGSGGSSALSGGNGGSGIVVIRYPGSPRATGGTITSVGSDTVHTFTASGTFTMNTVTMTVGDLSGNSNNATLINGAGYSASNGGSMVFDGVDDYASVVLPSNTEFISNPSLNNMRISFSIWCNVQSGYYILSSGAQTGSTGIAFSYQSGNPFIAIKGNSSVSVFDFSSTTFPLNTWINWSMTSDGNSMKLYKNGQLLSQVSFTSNSFSDLFKELHIGKPNNNPSFTCNMNASNILFYDRALTAAEVQQNFNATRGRYGI
jgi:hypothetical protein